MGDQAGQDKWHNRQAHFSSGSFPSSGPRHLSRTSSFQFVFHPLLFFPPVRVLQPGTIISTRYRTIVNARTAWLSTEYSIVGPFTPVLTGTIGSSIYTLCLAVRQSSSPSIDHTRLGDRSNLPRRQIYFHVSNDSPTKKKETSTRCPTI